MEVETRYSNDIYQQFGVTLPTDMSSKCALEECQRGINIYEAAVDMECTNVQCQHPKMMHLDCFKEYELRLVDELSKQARYKQKNHREIQQTFWSENCYKLVYKHCTCACQTGCLLKKMHKSGRRRGESTSSNGHDSGVSCSPKQSPEFITEEMRLGAKVDSTEKGTMREFIESEISVIMKNVKVKKRGKKNIASIGTVITDTHIDSKPSEITAAELKLRPMKQCNFKHRSDYHTLKISLPPEKFNSTHIAVESSGFGCDELRSYILSNLALCNADTLDCLICRDTLTVYDSFPLINGLMFQSPNPYTEQLTPNDYEPPHLKIDGEAMYIHAVCVACAQQDDILFMCRYCSTPWSGAHFQLGNLIKYDIFAAQPCCPQRVTCNRCNQPLGDVKQPRPYSYFSRMEQCYQCGYADYHCIKPLSTYRFQPSSELNSMMQSVNLNGSHSSNQNSNSFSTNQNRDGETSPKSTSPAQQIQMQQKQQVETKKKERSKKERTFGSCAMDEVVVKSTMKSRKT